MSEISFGSPPVERPKKRRRHRLHKPPAGPSGAVKNEINVTPLVDVVLVLLIIFMVVTPMLSRGVAVDLPLTKHHEKRNDTGEEMMVSVTKEGRVFLDADPLPEDEMVDRLKRALAKATKGVHVKADKNAKYGDVRKVLEGLHQAGATQVALGSDDVKEGAK